MSSSFLSHLIFSLIASQNIKTAEQFHAKFFIQTDRSELRLEALEYIKEALQPKPDLDLAADRYRRLIGAMK